jgi:hypothetical protein
MNCPFDVTLRYRKPFLPNIVGELVTHSRPTPLEWLSQAELISRTAADSVFGDQVTLTIPVPKST